MNFGPTRSTELAGEGFRFSIAGIMILTAAVAAHVAIGKLSLELLVLVAPFSLSILSVEVLRRWFRLPLMTALITGILLGAFLYSFSTGAVASWEYWQRFDAPEMAGRRPLLLTFVKIGVRQGLHSMSLYLVAGMLVMCGYCAFILLRGRRAKAVVKSQLLRRAEEIESTEFENDLP